MSKKKKINKKKVSKKYTDNPEILYKYVTLESVEPILENASLRFTNPLEFNDPFDCNMPSFDFGHVDIKKLIKDEFSRTMGIDHRSQEFNQFIASITPKFNELRDGILNESKSMLADWDKLLSNFRILSLTTKPDNILMWSHYAKDHKGVVLGFKVNSSLGEAGKVNYDEGNLLLGRFLESMSKVLIRDVINDGGSNTLTDVAASKTIDVLFKYFFLKKEEWSYENEYRIVMPANHAKVKNLKEMDVVEFDKQDLLSITFGIGTPEESIRDITAIIESEYQHVSILRAYKDGWNLKI